MNKPTEPGDIAQSVLVPEWQRTAYERRVTHVDSWGHVRALSGWKRERIIEIAETAGRYYEPFDVRIVGKEKWRHIDNPQGELRALQTGIQRRILRFVPMPEYIVGGVPGRSVRDHARVHSGNPVAVTIDLRNCFPSITHRDVFRAFAYGLGYRNDIANALTKITTFCGRVPQGAPTSTMIANLALREMHDAIAEHAADHGVAYSAWIDDLTLSGRNPDHLIPRVLEIIREFGYAVSWEKIKVMRGWREPVVVVGAVVNNAISASRQRRGDIEREILALSSRAQVTQAQLNSVRGKIAWVSGLREPQGARLERLASEMLPVTGVAGERPIRVEYRRCARARRHACKRAG